MPRYDSQFRQLIANSITTGTPTREIAKGLDIHRATIDRYRQNIQAFSVHNPSLASIGYHPLKIHLATREAMIDLLTSNSTIYLDEIQD